MVEPSDDMAIPRQAREDSVAVHVLPESILTWIWPLLTIPATTLPSCEHAMPYQLRTDSSVDQDVKGEDDT